MKEMELSVAEIKELMEAFDKNKLGSLKIRHGEFCLKMDSRRVEQAAAAVSTAPAPAPAVSVEAEEEALLPGNVVTSPIVGTFYAAPAPDKDPYVTAGSQVKKGDVLFIIESMKLMNEVTSDFDGTVSKILVNNAEGVEYGQPILCIE